LLRVRWFGHIERMNSERIPKQIVTVRIEGIRRRGRPQERGTFEVEEDLQEWE
jgi:hypothetical protein